MAERYTPVAGKSSTSPSFRELLKQGQSFLTGLEAFETHVALELADRHAELSQVREQIANLENELSSLQESQRQWSVERERLTGEVGRLQHELEAAGRQHEEERQHLSSEHQAARLRHDEEQRDLRQRLSARESAFEQAREELRRLQAQSDELRQAQLEWAADRQRLASDLERLRSTHDALQAEHRTLQNELAATKAEMEREREATGAKSEADRRRLETQLGEAQERIAELQQGEVERKGEYERLSRAQADLIAQASKLNSESTARRQAMASEIDQLHKELSQATGAIARNAERDRQRDKWIGDLKESWQREKTELEIALRKAMEASTGIGLEQLHGLSSHLNAITGFSELLLEETSNAVTPEERLDFLRRINQSGKRFAEEIRKLSPPSAESTPLENQTDTPAVPPPGHHAPTILVADADPATRERVEPFLARAGYDVIVAANASEAFERALESQPIAVLVDSALPPSGATGLIDELKRERRTRDLPIVLTSKDDDELMGVNMAHLDFLPKPIDRQQLLQAMVKFDLLADHRRAKKMPGTLLLIDDDRQNIRLVKATLKSYNIHVLSAESGKEGIELAQKHHPELIICDLMMPQVDGYEVIEALRGSPETADIPIIVYTAKNMSAEEQDRLQGKIQTIIQKGEFNKERFLDLVRKRGERRSEPGDAETGNAEPAEAAA